MKPLRLTEAAVRNHEEFFPNHQSMMQATDPEFIELFDNWAFDEVLRNTKLDAKTRVLLTIIQRATGAPESLQRFFIDSQRRIFGHPTWKDFRRIKSDSRVRLDRLLHERGDMLRYFSGDGEDWEHSIKLLKIERSIRRLKRATDVAGNRSIHATRERA